MLTFLCFLKHCYVLSSLYKSEWKNAPKSANKCFRSKYCQRFMQSEFKAIMNNASPDLTFPISQTITLLQNWLQCGLLVEPDNLGLTEAKLRCNWWQFTRSHHRWVQESPPSVPSWLSLILKCFLLGSCYLVPLLKLMDSIAYIRMEMENRAFTKLISNCVKC